MLLTLTGLLVSATPSAADQGVERVLLFSSLIRIHPDATVTVSETITVNCRREQINRGIVREFPTTYKTGYGRKVKVRFDITEVLRDGRPEPHHLKRADNGIQVYIGKSDQMLEPGEYTYTLTYITDRQIGYFEDFDELYWNVTGNGWQLAIDRAEAVIELPPGASLLDHAGYTGLEGAAGSDYLAEKNESGRMSFSTTRPLMPFEGLTVAVSWPKGSVREPTASESFGLILKDNIAAIAGLIWLFFLLVYYSAAWLAVGRDPSRGTIIPLFEPPGGLSPASLRFVHRMGFDHKTFAAAVVGLAVKGRLTITEKGKLFTLHKVKGTDTTGLHRGEKKVMGTLFKGRSAVTLKNKNHKTIKGAMDALKKALRDECEKVYFITNRAFFFPGLAFTLLALLTIVLIPPIRPEVPFLAVWLSIWTFGCFFLMLRVWRGVRDAFARQEGRVGAMAAALLSSVILLPFLAGEVVGAVLFATALSPAAAASLGAILMLDIIFYQLLKAPTPAGRKLMDKIEGFRLFLSVAEKERLTVLHPPDNTPELFERYLPHAMALSVENDWSRQFEEVLAAGTAEENSSWSPAWYSGRSWQGLDASGFATSLGSGFSGAIASSSSAPGSSSGSGGGGSSGGGGGGGGGGGW